MYLPPPNPPYLGPFDFLAAATSILSLLPSNSAPFYNKAFSKVGLSENST